MSLASLKIRTKLLLIVAVLSIPLLLFAWLFVQQSFKDIHFAEKEKAGTAYLQGVWGTLSALAQVHSDETIVPSSRLAGVPEISGLAASFDAGIGTAEKSSALGRSLAAIGWPAARVTDHEALEASLSSALALITAIADGSNLTLDPDLDSYYVMDAIVFKMPSLPAGSSNLMREAQDQKAMSSLTDEAKTDLMVHLGKFDDGVGGVEASFNAAMKSNADGLMRAKLSQLLDAFHEAGAAFSGEMKRVAVALRDDAGRSQVDLSRLTEFEKRFQVAADALWRPAAGELDRLLQARIDGLWYRLWSMLAIGGAIALAALALAFHITRQIANRLSALRDALDQLAQGNLAAEIAGSGSGSRDEIGAIGACVLQLQKSLQEAEGMRAQQAEQQKIAATIATENARIKVALDNCSTNVMVADAEHNIVYLNDSVVAMMRAAEADLRKELPRFDVSKLLGANVDIFHKNPAHQRGMLEKLSSTYRTQIKVGGHSFALVANPVLDDHGNRLGSIVEWRDITAELAVEEEIDNVVGAAGRGYFRERISLEGKQGFMRNLAESMNRLCGTTADALEEVNKALQALAAGDLTKRVRGEYAGMFHELKENLNTTSERLAEIVSGVGSGANEVASAANEIADGTNDLSRRTEQQASSLEETAASMEQMSTTIKQNAENATEANRLAATASSVASTGGDVVGRAVTAMSRIEDSSHKMSDIIGVIDEIAFQTNLLALNAAVEAARAGDAGKGFAVVASEVRSLAQRSSAAAKDIKTLIVESGSQVQDGVKLVRDAGGSLREIVASIKSVASIITDIASASREQATGVEEINKAVAQMDEMTQQNSALVEENAAACRMLQEQAQGMQQRMSTFVVDGSAPKARPATAEKPAAAAPAKAAGRKVRSPARKVATGGAGAMQAALEANFDSDADWKEF
jgi:methyl-accepting chemotaxis protein